MPWVVKKHSLPNWVKTFSTMRDARAELLRNICASCLKGDVTVRSDGTVMREPPVDTSSIDDLLNTSCGYEYDCYPGEDDASERLVRRI